MKPSAGLSPKPGLALKSRAVLFMILAYVGTIVALLVVSDTLRARWILLTAHCTAWFLDLLGAEGRSYGSMVTSIYGSVNIIYECTGVFPLILLTSAFAAFPSGWRSKLIGLSLALPFMLALNQLRILSIIYLGVLVPESVDTIHHIIWPAIILFCTSLVFIAWARNARRAG